MIKGGAGDIFDLHYQSIDAVASMFDEPYMIRARESFSEIVDGLKKEKKIKSTLEVVIVTNSHVVKALPVTEAEDWFVVSGIGSIEAGEVLGSFELDGERFTIARATRAKCPRCWKFHATDEERPCPRCAEVLGA